MHKTKHFCGPAFLLHGNCVLADYRAVLLLMADEIIKASILKYRFLATMISEDVWLCVLVLVRALAIVFLFVYILCADADVSVSVPVCPYRMSLLC